jgi:hypothetical protein
MLQRAHSGLLQLVAAVFSSCQVKALVCCWRTLRPFHLEQRLLTRSNTTFAARA